MRTTWKKIDGQMDLYLRVNRTADLLLEFRIFVEEHLKGQDLLSDTL
jgi:hypothetical protein